MEVITLEEFKKSIYKYQEKDLYLYITGDIRTMLEINKSIVFIKGNRICITNEDNFDVDIELNSLTNFYKLGHESNLRLEFNNNMEIVFDFDINS